MNDPAAPCATASQTARVEAERGGVVHGVVQRLGRDRDVDAAEQLIDKLGQLPSAGLRPHIGDPVG